MSERSRPRLSQRLRRSLRVGAAALGADGRLLWRTLAHPGRPDSLRLLLDQALGAAAWQKPGAALLALLAEAYFQHVTTLELALAAAPSAPGEALAAALRAGLHSLPALRRVRLLCPLPAEADLALLSALAEAARQRQAAFNVVLRPGEPPAGSEAVVQALQAQGLEPAARCPLDDHNAYLADDFLLWCEQSGLRDWSFELAVAPQTAEQRFHLCLFFSKLSRRKDVSLRRRLWYSAVSASLETPGAPAPRPVERLAVLDLDGRLAAWPGAPAPRGWQPQPAPQAPAAAEPCALPPPALQAPPTSRDLARLGLSAAQNLYAQRRARQFQRQPLVSSVAPAGQSAPSQWKRVLITGWYGTETTGDKAILGEIVHFVRQRSPGCHITVTTINRAISQQTRLEMPELHGSEIVEIARADQPALIESVDAVIMGGGPLMETTQMEFVWRIFREANRQKKARIIFGCGVGPFHSERIETITGNILHMATAGFLRDAESQAYALRLAPGNSLGLACDPAFAFVNRWLEKQPALPDAAPRLTTLLRANTKEFASKEQVSAQNERAAGQMAALLSAAALAQRLQVQMLHMNAPWIGGDDRLFNRQVARLADPAARLHVERAYLPTEALLGGLHGSTAGLAMRYHGHIFCMSLGIPFLSINYTGSKGKVFSLVQRTGYQEWSIDWSSIEPEQAAQKLGALLEQRQHWSAHLLAESARLRAGLAQTYQQVFGI